MKTIISIITVSLGIFFLNSTESQAQCNKQDVAQLTKINTSKRVTLKAYGNCEICEARIEKAAEDVKGVYSADWNKKTKLVTISYNKTIVSNNDLHNAITNAGHDTNLSITNDMAYEKFAICCNYERKSE